MICNSKQTTDEPSHGKMKRLYIRIEKNGIRLSIEGSQMIGDKSTKNVLELNDTQIKEWVKGEVVRVDQEINGFVIIKNKDYYYGSGLIKEHLLLNYFPKPRRLRIINE